MDRTRVLMIESHDSLQQGEHVNLPHDVAKRLIEAGKAKHAVEPTRPQETKPTGPQETKVVTPKESKKKGSTK